MKVGDIIKPNKFCLNCNDTITYAIEEFGKRGLKEMPILENEKIIGILKLEDLLKYVSQEKSLSLSVKEIMNPEPCITKLDTPLDQIIDIHFDT